MFLTRVEWHGLSVLRGSLPTHKNNIWTISISSQPTLWPRQVIASRAPALGRRIRRSSHLKKGNLHTAPASTPRRTRSLMASLGPNCCKDCPEQSAICSGKRTSRMRARTWRMWVRWRPETACQLSGTAYAPVLFAGDLCDARPTAIRRGAEDAPRRGPAC